MNYETVIGLEVHAQLSTRSKMFCGCPTTFGAPPNTQTCPVCLGLPGVLPVVNRRAVEFGIRTALAFGCRVNEACRFARKHYYYPDMPKNYQISQYEEPLAEDGALEIDVEGGARAIAIQRLHLEEDVGKLVHEGTLETAQASLVDFNRSGVALMETVSRPELRSPEEAAAYLRAFRAVLIFLGVCDGNMEEGSLRCDANVSIRPRVSTTLGTKVEIKNLNSFRNVQHALEFEVRRQAKALDAGERIVQETRLWDADRGYTRSTRSKEFAHDYRYFPEPDLLPVHISTAWRDEVRRQLPELPDTKRARFVASYAITPYDAGVLTATKALADYFEAVVKAGAPGKAAANWMQTELLRRLNDSGKEIDASPVSAKSLAALIAFVESGKITAAVAKKVFATMFESGRAAVDIVAAEGLGAQVSDSAIEAAARDVISKNPDNVAKYKSGNEGVFKFFVGQVMRATRGQANPQSVNDILRRLLS